LKVVVPPIGPKTFLETPRTDLPGGRFGHRPRHWSSQASINRVPIPQDSPQRPHPARSRGSGAHMPRGRSHDVLSPPAVLVVDRGHGQKHVHKHSPKLSSSGNAGRSRRGAPPWIASSSLNSQKPADPPSPRDPTFARSRFRPGWAREIRCANPPRRASQNEDYGLPLPVMSLREDDGANLEAALGAKIDVD